VSPPGPGSHVMGAAAGTLPCTPCRSRGPIRFPSTTAASAGAPACTSPAGWGHQPAARGDRQLAKHASQPGPPAGPPAGSDDAQCSQVVSVQPSSSYTLTGWVEGDYVFLGDSGTGSSDTDDWTPSAPSWTELSASFTTGLATTTVTVYINGWYGQPERHRHHVRVRRRRRQQRSPRSAVFGDREAGGDESLASPSRPAVSVRLTPAG
jgi:hypothetical protein